MPLRSTTLRSNVHPKINGDSANCPARHAGCSPAFARAAVAPRGAVAQLEVVRRFLASPVNEEQDNLNSRDVFKRRLMIVSAIVLLFGGFCGSLAYRFRTPRALAPQEIQEVSTFIQQQTSYPIRFIERHRDGTIEVDTGVLRGPLDGGGETFRIKKTGNTWKVIQRSLWIA